MSELFNSKDLIHPSAFGANNEVEILQRKINEQNSVINELNRNLTTAADLVKKLTLKLEETEKKFEESEKKRIVSSAEGDMLIEKLDKKLFAVREELRLLKAEKSTTEDN